jgi:hypothetical protein
MTIFNSILHVVSEKKIFEPIRDFYGPWQPCWITDHNESNNSWLDHANEHSCHVWSHFLQWFSRRRLKCLWTDGRLRVRWAKKFRWTMLSKWNKNPIFRHIKPNNSGTAKVKIVKNERDPPLFTGKLLIKFQNILRNTTQVIIRHRVKILFSVISSPITLERQKWKSSKKKGILLSSPVNNW